MLPLLLCRSFMNVLHPCSSKSMLHSVGHMLRTVNAAMTAKGFCEWLKNKDSKLRSKMFSILVSVRFKRIFLENGHGCEMVDQKTVHPLSSSHVQWPSGIQSTSLTTYGKVNSDFPNVDKMMPTELCATDPVNVFIHFNQKWNAIFKNLCLVKWRIFFIVLSARREVPVTLTLCSGLNTHHCTSNWQKYNRRDQSLHQ